MKIYFCRGNVYTTPSILRIILDMKLTLDKETVILDKIDKVSKYAAKKATNFIKNLTDEPVKIKTVKVVVVTPEHIKEELEDGGEKIGASVGFSGDIEGIGILIFPQKPIPKLMESIGIKRDEVNIENSSNNDEIKEIFSSIISAYLETLVNFMNTSLNLLSLSFIRGSEKEIAEKLLKNYNNDNVILIFHSELYISDVKSKFKVLVAIPSKSLIKLSQ